MYRDSLGGGANRPGRNASGGRRRMHSTAWHHDQISWRLLARADAESGGRGVFPWASIRGSTKSDELERWVDRGWVEEGRGRARG
jgi:hypothetical protein